MLFVSVVVSMEINRRHYFRRGPRTYIYVWGGGTKTLKTQRTPTYILTGLVAAEIFRKVIPHAIFAPLTVQNQIGTETDAM